MWSRDKKEINKWEFWRELPYMRALSEEELGYLITKASWDGEFSNGWHD